MTLAALLVLRLRHLCVSGAPPGGAEGHPHTLAPVVRGGPLWLAWACFSSANRRPSPWAVCQAGAESVVGLGLGAVLLLQERQVEALATAWGSSVVDHIVRRGCVWLMGAPAGFKLNHVLSQAAAMASLILVQGWVTVALLLRPWLWLGVRLLAACALLCGAGVATAAAADALGLACLPLALMAAVVRAVHARQLRVLAALWRMFHGRKRNPLRRRVDSCRASVEELAVASALFVPLLLLLPTTSAFCLFFGGMQLVLEGVRALMFMVSNATSLVLAAVPISLLNCMRQEKGIPYVPVTSLPQGVRWDGEIKGIDEGIPLGTCDEEVLGTRALMAHHLLSVSQAIGQLQLFSGNVILPLYLTIVRA